MTYVRVIVISLALFALVLVAAAAAHDDTATQPPAAETMTPEQPPRVAEMAALRLCWCPSYKPEEKYTCRRVKVVYSCWDHWGCREPKKYNNAEEAECLARQRAEGSRPAV